MELIKQMNVEQLRAEQARLKAGNVGTGFDKQYLVQCAALVDKELKNKTRVDEKAKSVQAPKAKAE
jgi:hypothetical protein